MKKKLVPNFRFKSHSYATPNQKWLCGHREKPCHLGPTSKGKCIVTFECNPVKQGDRWVCTRTRKGSDQCACDSGPSPTGVCGQPITPCSPRPTMGHLLKRANWYAFALVSAVLLLAFSSQKGTRFATPGPLTQAHSHGESNCQICHTEAGTGTPLAWFTGKASHEGMSELNCIKCHDYGGNALHPHSLPPETLTALRDASEQTESFATGGKPMAPQMGILRAAFAAWSPNAPDTQIACSRCHQEHQGRSHSLTSMSSTQCQVCHEKAFHSLSDGHPSFNDYPFTEPARIIFNHQSHFEEHFPKSSDIPPSQKNCISCHAVDDHGEYVNLRPFSQSCASCHEDEVHSNDPDGAKLPILRAPWVDIDTLEGEELAVGAWPDDWDSLTTTFSPASMLLLSASTPTETLQSFWQADVDLLEDQDPDQTLAFFWAFKQLLGDLRTKGVESLTQRLTATLGRELTAMEKAEISVRFPQEEITNMVDAWFPDLQSELEQHTAEESPEAALQEAEDMEDRLDFDIQALGHGWIRSDTDLTLYYQPTRHEDTFMKLLLESAQKNTLAGREVFTELGGNSNMPKAGRCLKCHSENSSAGARINWVAKQKDANHRPFTRFSHVAHFRNEGMLDNKGCFTCHEFNTAESSTEFLAPYHYFNTSPSSDFTGSFASITKESCVTCHKPQHVGDNCLTCHNYHVGDFPLTARSTELIESVVNQSQ